MPPSTRPQGVRFKVLRDLLQEAQGLGLSSTTEVCNGLIKPRTEEQKCAYVDTLPADAVADATVFISHAWRYDLADSVDVMEQYEAEHPGSVFWFDLVMNNQHGTAERPFEWWCHTFQHSIEQIGTVVLVLAPWRSPIPPTRSWCLFEIMCSLNAGCEKVDFRIRMPTAQASEFVNALRRDSSSAMGALIGVKTEESEAFLPTDKENIFKAVEASIGFQQLNSMVNDQMRLWFVQQGMDAVEELEASGADLSGDLRFADTCVNLAGMLNDFGRHKDVLQLNAKALRILQQVFGEEHGTTAAAYNNMALAYDELGELEPALEHFGRALRIQQKVLGEDHPATADIYNNMAVVHTKQGNHELALEFYSKGLHITQKALGEDHPDTAATYNNMANVYQVQGKYELALEYYAKDLRITQKALGEGHPDTAATYLGVAGVYSDQGKHELALENYNKALRVYQKILGEDHPDTAGAYFNIARVYNQQGKHDLALEYHNKALRIRERIFGEEHPETLAAKHNIERLQAAIAAQQDTIPSQQVTTQASAEGGDSQRAVAAPPQTHQRSRCCILM